MTGYEMQLVRLYDEMAASGIPGIYRKHLDGNEHILLPIRHVFIKANLEVTIDMDGNFINAVIIGKDRTDQLTVTGATEDAAARGNNNDAKFICDKIDYVASDASDTAWDFRLKEEEREKNRENALDRHKNYKNLLKSVIDYAMGLTEHTEAARAVKAVYQYTANNNLISDLLSKAGSEEMKTFLGIEKGKLNRDVQIRFIIKGLQEEKSCWRNIHIQKLWTDYMDDMEYQTGTGAAGKEKLKDVSSFFSGEWMQVSKKMPSNLLWQGDSCKTHSSNEKKGGWDFTFRGRFVDSKDIFSVGARDMSKYYCMFRYILDESCINLEDYFLCIWDCEKAQAERSWTKNAPAALLEVGERSFCNNSSSNDRSERRTLLKGEWMPGGEIMVLGMRKSYPGQSRGRLSVLEYMLLPRDEYLSRIVRWHTEGGWYHREYDKEAGKPVEYFGMPDIWRMAALLFGKENKTGYMEPIKRKEPDRNISYFYEEIMKAILYGDRISESTVQRAVEKACHPMKFSKRYNHDAVVDLACAFIAKRYGFGNMKEFKMTEKNKRSFLFGQLLGLAHCIEYFTYEDNDKKKGRRTNAEQNMELFRMRPASVWTELYNWLSVAYLKKLDYQQRVYLTKKMDGLICEIGPDDFKDKKLSCEFLCGYSVMKRELMKPSAKIADKAEAVALAPATA